MRNKIDFTLPPDVLFHNPWQDDGVSLLSDPDPVWWPVSGGHIKGFAASAYPEINRKLAHYLRTTETTRMYSEPLAYRTVPVLVEAADFRKSYVLCGDKILLSGAAGTRALNRFRWENEESADPPDAQLERYFLDCQTNAPEARLPVRNTPLETDTPFVIPCRNTFNYYHFTTESLTQLTALDELDFDGPIIFHFPNQEERQQPFARAFVEALFPELADRVQFQRTPASYDRALMAFDLIGTHFQAPELQTAPMDAHLPRALRDNGGASAMANRVPLSANTLNSGLLSLRDRGLQAVADHSFDHLPKRFFVGRDDRKSRQRSMAGEDLLFEHLQMFGFEYVVFENLSPLDQIALMAQAEVMVSYHGAGFANMLFANPDALMIEIGTLQTAQNRWADFWPLAHASRCTYVNFFGDFNTVNPKLEPHFGTDGIVPVAISEQAVGQIMAFIVTWLGHLPKFETATTLERTAQQVMQAGRPERALGLLEAHDALVRETASLCLLKADCHKALDEPKSELLALDQSYKVDPDRWQTLVRMIWCAKRCERPQVIRWALSRLGADFPDRHDAFVGNHQWVRYVA